MPTAVFHILFPLIILSLYRNHFLTKEKRALFSLSYVFIGGLAGVIPDIDFIPVWILSFFINDSYSLHGKLSHSLFILPVLFFVGFLFFSKFDYKFKFRNDELKVSIILFLLCFGSAIHIFLDYFLGGGLFAFYPFINEGVGFNPALVFPESLQPWFIPSLEGIFLVCWLIYLFYYRKIKDFS